MSRTTIAPPSCTAFVWLRGLVMTALMASVPQAMAQPSVQKGPQRPNPPQAPKSPQDKAPQAKETQAKITPKAEQAPSDPPVEPSTTAPTTTPAQQEPKQVQVSPLIPPGLTQSPQSAPASSESTKKTAPAPRAKLDPSISPEEIRQRVWNDRYRPGEDPFRFQGLIRAGIFAGGKSKHTVGGRGFGLEIEAGVSKNFWSIAAALGGQFGNYYRAPLGPLPLHPEITPLLRATHPGYRTAANFSTGLRGGIGRLALQGYGFVEPRLGYDLSWSVISPISGVRAKEIAMGHGPALRVDAGFLSSPQHRAPKFRRVFGASLGWNMTVGGIGYDLPTTHYVFVGFFAQIN